MCVWLWARALTFNVNMEIQAWNIIHAECGLQLSIRTELFTTFNKQTGSRPVSVDGGLITCSTVLWIEKKRKNNTVPPHWSWLKLSLIPTIMTGSVKRKSHHMVSEDLHHHPYPPSPYLPHYHHSYPPTSPSTLLNNPRPPHAQTDVVDVVLLLTLPDCCISSNQHVGCYRLVIAAPHRPHMHGLGGCSGALEKHYQHRSAGTQRHGGDHWLFWNIRMLWLLERGY